MFARKTKPAEVVSEAGNREGVNKRKFRRIVEAVSDESDVDYDCGKRPSKATFLDDNENRESYFGDYYNMETSKKPRIIMKLFRTETAQRSERDLPV